MMFSLWLSSQRIFGETSEKNLYLSQLIILDTLEKCLAGVSFTKVFKMIWSCYLKTSNVTSSVLYCIFVHYFEIKLQNGSVSLLLYLRSETQTTVNVLILHQSHSPHLWEVPLWTSRPGLHLQASGGSLAFNGNCCQLLVQVFVISVYGQMEARYLSVFVVMDWNRFKKLLHNTALLLSHVCPNILLCRCYCMACDWTLNNVDIIVETIIILTW